MIQDFVSVLRNSQVQVHIWHNQVDGASSFSAHMALGGYYEEIADLVDGLVESIQGVYPRIKGYKSVEYFDFESVDKVVLYFKGLYDYVQRERLNVPQETWVQNQIDNVAELIASTLYKLSLK